MKSSASLTEELLNKQGQAIMEAAEGGGRGEAIVSQAEVFGVEAPVPVLPVKATGKLVTSLTQTMLRLHLVLQASSKCKILNGALTRNDD